MSNHESLDWYLEDCFKSSTKNISASAKQKKKIRRELKPKYNELISKYQDSELLNNHLSELEKNEIPDLPVTNIASQFSRVGTDITHKNDFEALCGVLSQDPVKGFIFENYSHKRSSSFLHSISSIYLNINKYVSVHNLDNKKLNLEFVNPAIEFFEGLNYHDNILYLLSGSFEKLSELVVSSRVANDLFKNLVHFRNLKSLVPLVNGLSDGLTERTFNFEEDFKKRLYLIKINKDLIRNTIIPYETDDCFYSPSINVMRAIGSVISFGNNYLLTEVCKVFEGYKKSSYKPEKTRAFYHHNIKFYKDREVLRLIKLAQNVHDWEIYDPELMKFYVKNVKLKDQDLEYNLPIKVINNVVRAHKVSYNYLFSSTEGSNRRGRIRKGSKSPMTFGNEFSKQFYSHLNVAMNLGSTQEEKIKMIDAWAIDTFRLIKDPNMYQMDYDAGRTELQKLNSRLKGVAV